MQRFGLGVGFPSTRAGDCRLPGEGSERVSKRERDISRRDSSTSDVRSDRSVRPARSLWFHACSVGEVETAMPLVRLFARAYPDDALILSTVTETGQARARKLLGNEFVRYLPFDFGFAIRRHLSSVPLPRFFIVMETEIWPKLYSELSQHNIPLFIANGRISDRAWRRYRRAVEFLRGTMACVRAVGARTVQDAERFRILGARNVSVLGNIKFDRGAAPAPEGMPSGKFLLFASTHPGEDELFVRTWRSLRNRFPRLRAVLAPRHIERAPALAKKYGGALRSAGWKDESLLVLDTHGELAGLFSGATVAIIGGSFVPHGGHNPFEAAVQGVPILWGPHMQNFRDAVEVLEGRGGETVRENEELAEALEALLSDEDLRRQRGAAARAAASENTGAAERHFNFFRDRLFEGEGERR